MNYSFARLWAFGLAWVVLPMLSLNVIDILVVRGMNTRPQGYFAYWMIPLFDVLFFPLFFAVSMKISKSFRLTSVENYGTAVVAGLIAIISVLQFWDMEIVQVAADPSTANWTVDITGHNFYAYVHAVIMVFVIWYVVAFFTRYSRYAYQSEKVWPWLGFAITVIVFVSVTWVAVAPPWAMSPNEGLSHLFGVSVNF